MCGRIKRVVGLGKLGFQNFLQSFILKEITGDYNLFGNLLSLVCFLIVCYAVFNVIMILLGFVGEIPRIQNLLILVAEVFRRNFNFLF